MKLTREEALKLHRQMWTDMQTALGDNPRPLERAKFKRSWCESHFPDDLIYAHCFLCEYVKQNHIKCNRGEWCLVKWPHGGCLDETFDYETAPISEILALPEREVDDEISDN